MRPSRIRGGRGWCEEWWTSITLAVGPDRHWTCFPRHLLISGVGPASSAWGDLPGASPDFPPEHKHKTRTPSLRSPTPWPTRKPKQAPRAEADRQNTLHLRDGGSSSMFSFFPMHGSPPNRARPQERPAPVQSGRHKRKNSIEDALQPASDHKRQRVPLPRTAEGAFCEPADARGAHEHVDPLAFWVKEQRWPQEQDWPEATSETDATVDPPFARKKLGHVRYAQRSEAEGGEEHAIPAPAV